MYVALISSRGISLVDMPERQDELFLLEPTKRIRRQDLGPEPVIIRRRQFIRRDDHTFVEKEDVRASA